METIRNIEEIFDYKEKEDTWRAYDGFKITTDKQIIYFLIGNNQNCCENWGTLTSNDNTNEFIGAELNSIVQVDTALNTKELDNGDWYDNPTSNDCIFLNLETSKGTLQFVCYNQHNGYYGHQVKIISQQLKLDTYL